MTDGLITAQLDTNKTRAAILADRIAQIEWFSRVSKSVDDEQTELLTRSLREQLGLVNTSVQWVDLSDLPRLVGEYNIAANELWDHVRCIPDCVRDAAVKASRTEVLSYAIHDVPESVFHQAFDGAYHSFGAEHEEVVRFAVAAAMFVCGLAIAWELVADVKGMELNPLLPLLGLFERGYLPIGVFMGVFLIA